MKSFKEIHEASEKMRTKYGGEYPIAKVKKVEKFADSIDMSDSRLVAGMILDWCRINKVKIDNLIKKVGAGEIDKKLVKRVVQNKNPRTKTKGSEELIGLMS